MKNTIIAAAVIAAFLALVLYARNWRQHQYEIRSVHDVNGHEAFVRIDLSSGEICALGRGYAVRVDFASDNRPDVPILPFCHDVGK